MQSVHPNIISNHRFRWKQENGRECPLGDEDIANIVRQNEFTRDTHEEEDDEIQADMTRDVKEKAL